MDRKELGKQYFLQGYNCAQAVVLAFKDLVEIDEKTLVQLSSSFGGGISRLRETCGVVSAMALINGLLFGYNDSNDLSGKNNLYQTNQMLIKKFEERNKTLVCRDLLGLKEKHSSANSSIRNEQFYKERPCLRLIGDGCQILQEYLESVNK